ncbi:hypothetical protein ACFV4P_04090 [Kitasatospora sp. NPDC059795]|uniref:hypothetical protein n=1 Tax=Kitasatospora sp. NPDC059795 TaxID=3346949 RepID=UPI00365E4BDF
MSQRRSYNSGDFNLDDLFRPEPPATDGQGTPEQAAAQPPYAQPQHPVPQQQSAPPLGQSGSPEYWGTAPQAAAAVPAAQEDAGATQYLPPYPAGDPAAPTQVGYPQPGYAGGTFGGQQQYAAPAAPPASVQQPSYGGAYGAVPPQQAPQQPQAGYQETGGGNRRKKPNTKVLIGAGVAGVAVIGVLIGVLAGGGDEGGKGQAKDKASSSQSASAPAGGGGAAGGNGAVSPEAKAQAQAMSDLLGTASASRTSVVNAVSAVGKCQSLPDSQAALTAAAAQRQDLLKKLGDLKVDQLTDGAKLVEQLQKAWQASSTADSEYALWAGDMVAGCDGGKAKDNDHYRNGNTASGSATTAKEQAAGLWGAIASKAGLPNKGASEL